MMSFHYVEEAIRNSEEYICILSDQILLSTMPLLKERLEKGVFFKLIVPSNIVIAEPVRQSFMSSVGLPAERTASRYTENMGVVLIVTDRELALAAFPSLEGGFDYKGFRSTDPKGVNWGKEVFDYIWERSSDKIPDQILNIRRD
jgi:predicted transcriptional regulator